MPDVDLIMGNNLKSEIPDRVCELLQARENRETAVPQKRKEVLAYRDLRGYEDMGIVTASESEMSRAYIKIQEGCNRFCSYCLIPYARGVVRSRPLEEVLEEAKMLLNKGFRELVLTGINTALYGTEPEFDFQREPGEEGLNGLEAVIRRWMPWRGISGFASVPWSRLWWTLNTSSASCSTISCAITCICPFRAEAMLSWNP